MRRLAELLRELLRPRRVVEAQTNEPKLMFQGTACVLKYPDGTTETIWHVE